MITSVPVIVLAPSEHIWATIWLSMWATVLKPGSVKMSFSHLVLWSFHSSSALLSDITVWHLVKNFLPFPLLTNLRCVITELLISGKGALWFGPARPLSFISTSHNLIYPRTHRREEANKRQRVNFTLELDLSVCRERARRWEARLRRLMAGTDQSVLSHRDLSRVLHLEMPGRKNV